MASTTTRENLAKFIRENINESFRKNYNITDEVIQQKASQLWGEMEHQYETMRKYEKEVDDDVLVSYALERLAQEYVGFITNAEGIGETLMYVSHVLRENMIMAYIKDGGKVDWLTDEEKKEPHEYLILIELKVYLSEKKRGKHE